jgi:predicted AlkP superfamily phosphohydrolase/phosphomutase
VSARTLMVALDAADLSLIEQWTGDGSLPVLAALRSRGAFGRLETPGRWLPGSVWPTFWTATPPSTHGFHHYLAWSPDAMRVERPDPVLPGVVPFWRRLGHEGARVVAIDMPFAPTPVGLADGCLELCGWSTIESLEGPRAHPASFLDRVVAAHGAAPRRSEGYRLESASRVLALRDTHVEIAGRLADLCVGLLRDETIDLFTVCIPGPHRAGHRLWDDTGLAGGVPTRMRADFDDALRQVYIAADRALGRMIDAAGARDVFVYSPNGMGPNVSRVDVLEDLLQRILGSGGEHGVPDMLTRLRGRTPGWLRDGVKRRLPVRWQDGLTSYWRVGGSDWSRVEAFSVVADLHGYVRVNRRGRERLGCVAPEDAGALLERIADGLASFVDRDTGEPVVTAATRITEALPDGPALGRLPDLIVNWSPTPAARHRAIVSPRFGEVPWPTPGLHPTGRSGNHRAEGFLVASGPGIEAGAALDGADVMDVAPTVCTRLGAASPADGDRSMLPLWTAGA